MEQIYLQLKVINMLKIYSLILLIISLFVSGCPSPNPPTPPPPVKHNILVLSYAISNGQIQSTQQWYKDNIPILGATSPQYRISGSLINNGSYRDEYLSGKSDDIKIEFLVSALSGKIESIKITQNGMINNYIFYQ